MKLSIVTTLYCSSAYIVEFYQRILKTVSNITDDYEIIFVNDGSPDDSLVVAHNLFLNDDKVKIIELSRNYGHHKGMRTGLQHASGDYVFLIDSDLEERPELLEQFWGKLQNNPSLDVVYGVQNVRKGGWFERKLGKLYFYAFNKLSDELNVVKNLSTVRLMRKPYVQALLQFKEQGYYFGPVCYLAGFNQEPYYFTKLGKKGTSYKALHKYHVFLDSIITFSSKPLYFIFYLGLLVTSSSFIFILYLIVRKVIWGLTAPGWLSLMVMVSLFGGMNMFFTGVIAIYILQIAREVRPRPFSVVKKIYKTPLQENNIGKFAGVDDRQELVTDEVL